MIPDKLRRAMSAVVDGMLNVTEASREFGVSDRELALAIRKTGKEPRAYYLNHRPERVRYRERGRS